MLQALLRRSNGGGDTELQPWLYKMQLPLETSRMVRSLNEMMWMQTLSQMIGR